MIHEGEVRKIGKLTTEILQPGNFFIRAGMDLLREERPPEEFAWEVSRGRLVPPRYARQVKTFASWNVYHVEDGRRSAEPILSLKLDAAEGRLHVVRAILSHVWEAVDEGSNVIGSRETTAWVPEIVGSINLDEFPQEAELRDEIAHLVTAAVVGTSRLPLTSLEAPLPGFSLGYLAYFDRRGNAGAPLRSSRELMDLLCEGIGSGHATSELVKLLEASLRAADAADIPDLARLVVARSAARHIGGLLRILFNDVSLSPWTSLVDNILSLMRCLLEQGGMAVADEVDFLCHILLQLGRHLTAYDLSTYHHRGANYPDALLLDACLKRLLHRCEAHADLFLGDSCEARRRRRALRQGWWLRAHYEGHHVPDAPTSPGENARVLPAPHVRVPEEQLLQPGKRCRRLYDGDPIAALLGEQARLILQQSLRDLDHADELRELGLGVFIDRPLGAGKALGEPDLTPLLSYLAFSRSIASRRLSEFGQLARSLNLACEGTDLQARLAELPIRGLALDEIQPAATGIVSLADVRRVAEDFLLLRTLPAGARQFAAAFDWRTAARHLDMPRVFDRSLIVPVQPRGDHGPTLAVFDAAMNRTLELTADLREGYQVRRSVETPRAGLILHLADRDIKIPGLRG